MIQVYNKVLNRWFELRETPFGRLFQRTELNYRGLENHSDNPEKRTGEDRVGWEVVLPIDFCCEGLVAGWDDEKNWETLK